MSGVTYGCCEHCQHDDGVPESLPPHATPCTPEEGSCAEGSTVARG